MKLSKLLLTALAAAWILACSGMAYAEPDPKLWGVLKEAYFEKRTCKKWILCALRRRAAQKVARKCL